MKSSKLWTRAARQGRSAKGKKRRNPCGRLLADGWGWWSRAHTLNGRSASVPKPESSSRSAASVVRSRLANRPIAEGARGTKHNTKQQPILYSNSAAPLRQLRSPPSRAPVVHELIFLSLLSKKKKFPFLFFHFLTKLSTSSAPAAGKTQRLQPVSTTPVRALPLPEPPHPLRR